MMSFVASTAVWEKAQSSAQVHCANCRKCKLIRVVAPGGREYYLRVRCAAGHWRNSSGREKLHKYFSVARIQLDFCNNYEPMGDSEEYLQKLKKSLPIRDEMYTC